MSRRRERVNTGRTNTARKSVPHSPISRTPSGDAGSGGGAGSRSRPHSSRTASTIVTGRSGRHSMRRSESSRKLSHTGGSIVGSARSRGSRGMSRTMSRRKQLLFQQTQAGTAPAPFNVSQRLAKEVPRTRSELLSARRKKFSKQAMAATLRTYEASMGPLLDAKSRPLRPEIAEAAKPVSARTKMTRGGAGISNKTRTAPAFLEPGAPDGMANFQANPKHKSRTELMAARRAEWRPPMSYDFDGDGYVDNLELFIGCRLDVNKDGRIDTAERKEAVTLLAELQENYTFGLDAAGPVMTSYIEHRVSDQPQWSEEALAKLVPPWAITPRRSLHFTAREVDPTRTGHGQPNRKFPINTGKKERTLGSGPNILEAQAGAVGTGVMQKKQLAGMMGYIGGPSASSRTGTARSRASGAPSAADA